MDADVIVVGGGPSGLTIAGELAVAGIRVVVLERRTEVTKSRAGTLLPRVLELFDARGIADRFIRTAKSLQDWPFNLGHIWSGLKPVDWRHLNSRYGFTLIMPQHLTEEVLLQWCREEGADARFGHEVTELGAAGDHVFVDVSDAGKRQRLTAKFLIGADGSRSTVRKRLGMPFEGTPATFTGVLGDLPIDFPFPGRMKSVDSPYGWGLALHFGPGRTRIGFVHAERRSAPKDEPVTIEEYTRCVREIFGSDFAVKELVWSSRFTDQMRIVPSLRQGRVFMLGESSRIHYPASGVGMNFCIQDAFNLGWKLGYVLKGHAASELLDTYDRERRPVALELLRSVREQCAMQFNFTLDGIELRRHFESCLLPMPELNRRLGLELNGLSFPYSSAPGSHPLVGQACPDIDLILTNGKLSRIGEQLVSQQFLLLDLSGSGAFTDLRFSSPALKVIAAQGVRLPAEAQAIKAMLVRPDAYVGWATESQPSVADARTEVARWLSDAGRPP
jgi:2-polyprenyl-6-methoxyphenol hydroxylase-like FAD-dependent oxidoreductase